MSFSILRRQTLDGDSFASVRALAARIERHKMKVTHVFLALPAADHASAVRWYVRLFGRGPDMVPTEGEAVWRLAASASVYVVADPVRAGRATLTIAVGDLDALLAELRERGIAATIVMDAGMRTAVVADPDGNRIKFFEDPAG